MLHLARNFTPREWGPTPSGGRIFIERTKGHGGYMAIFQDGLPTDQPSTVSGRRKKA